MVYEKETDTPTGAITPQLLPEIESIILQLNAVSKDAMDTSNAKNKAAAKIIEKLNKRKKGNEKKAKSDPKLELPNIISAVAAYHSSINILNIWDLTVYQVYDLFARMQQNTIFDVLKMSVAAWETRTIRSISHNGLIVSNSNHSPRKDGLLFYKFKED